MSELQNQLSDFPITLVPLTKVNRERQYISICSTSPFEKEEHVMGTANDLENYMNKYLHFEKPADENVPKCYKYATNYFVTIFVDPETAISKVRSKYTNLKKEKQTAENEQESSILVQKIAELLRKAVFIHKVENDYSISCVQLWKSKTNSLKQDIKQVKSPINIPKETNEYDLHICTHDDAWAFHKYLEIINQSVDKLKEMFSVYSVQSFNLANVVHYYYYSYIARYKLEDYMNFIKCLLINHHEDGWKCVETILYFAKTIYNNDNNRKKGETLLLQTQHESTKLTFMSALKTLLNKRTNESNKNSEKISINILLYLLYAVKLKLQKFGMSSDGINFRDILNYLTSTLTIPKSYFGIQIENETLSKLVEDTNKIIEIETSEANKEANKEVNEDIKKTIALNHKCTNALTSSLASNIKHNVEAAVDATTSKVKGIGSKVGSFLLQKNNTPTPKASGTPGSSAETQKGGNKNVSSQQNSSVLPLDISMLNSIKRDKKVISIAECKNVNEFQRKINKYLSLITTTTTTTTNDDDNNNNNNNNDNDKNNDNNEIVESCDQYAINYFVTIEMDPKSIITLINKYEGKNKKRIIELFQNNAAYIYDENTQKCGLYISNISDAIAFYKYVDFVKTSNLVRDNNNIGVCTFQTFNLANLVYFYYFGFVHYYVVYINNFKEVLMCLLLSEDEIFKSIETIFYFAEQTNKKNGEVLRLQGTYDATQMTFLSALKILLNRTITKTTSNNKKIELNVCLYILYIFKHHIKKTKDFVSNISSTLRDFVSFVWEPQAPQAPQAKSTNHEHESSIICFATILNFVEDSLVNILNPYGLEIHSDVVEKLRSSLKAIIKLEKEGTGLQESSVELRSSLSCMSNKLPNVKEWFNSLKSTGGNVKQNKCKKKMRTQKKITRNVKKNELKKNVHTKKKKTREKKFLETKETKEQYLKIKFKETKRNKNKTKRNKTKQK